MSAPISDYALLSNSRSAALVDRRGAIDWLCCPHFDSPACFAAIVGTAENGRWLLGPVGEHTNSRRYLPGTLTLVNRYETATGIAEVTELLATTPGREDLIRVVRGIEGTVEFNHEWIVRFDYGDVVPWIHRTLDPTDNTSMIVASAGPDSLALRGTRLPSAHGNAHRGRFSVEPGQEASFALTWWPSFKPTPAAPDIAAAIASTSQQFQRWSAKSTYTGPYRDAVQASLAALRGMTDDVTGGIVAAPTTSLPEAFGGERNWDYRYCWLRDAALTLSAFLDAGYAEEVLRWRDWLLRAIAGDPAAMRIMYAIDGSRVSDERELTHLAGYADSRPVRVGNGATTQLQQDVLGEVMVAIHQARRAGLPQSDDAWALQVALINHHAENWDRPDQGLWEIRGPARRFTHSGAMSWVALDRGVRACVDFGMSGPVDKWRQVRDEIKTSVLAHGVSPSGHFTQHDQTDEVDASLLVLAFVGFVEPDDPRYLATVAKVESDLLRDGFVLRYRTTSGVDGLAGQENPFLACSFWLVSAYALTGRLGDARALMDRLVGLSNDVGLLSEEYDPVNKRFAGNFPQAFSHLALVDAAFRLRGAS